tara:strand:+ start:696 stop:1385 length:690 start_codon:yes stop_codon:yes gene_type:complete
LQATIKVHSSLHKYFDQTEFRADFNTYFDLVCYLSAMHPRFNHYMRMVNWGESDEGFAFLDKDLNVVTEEELHIRRIHEDDTIYLAPVIVGGGGKKGGLLAAVAVIGLIAFTGGAAAPALTQAAPAVVPSATGGLFSSFAAMPSFAQSLFLNVGMSLISSLFTKKKKPMDTDTSTRQAGAFGSLTNSTQSGTPIALHYGQVRVAGQMLSGYIDSDDHGKNDVIRVEDKF